MVSCGDWANRKLGGMSIWLPTTWWLCPSRLERRLYLTGNFMVCGLALLLLLHCGYPCLLFWEMANYERVALIEGWFLYKVDWERAVDDARARNALG